MATWGQVLLDKYNHLARKPGTIIYLYLPPSRIWKKVFFKVGIGGGKLGMSQDPRAAGHRVAGLEGYKFVGHCLPLSH